MAYTPYLNPLTVSLAGVTTTTWTTLSSGVPAGATGVKLLWVGGTASASAARFVRKNGSTDTFQSQTVTGEFSSTPISTEWNMGVDSSGNFQYYTASAAPTEGTMYVLGYFGSESVFLTNAVSLGALGTTFGTISCSSAIPGGGIAGFFFITGGDTGAFLSITGSTDNLSDAGGNISRNYLVGCDGSQNIRGIGNAGGGRTLYCQGYMTSGITWHTNAVNVTPGTAGSLQNVSQAGGDTGTIVANLYYLTSGGFDCTFQLAGQGATTIPVSCYPASYYAGPYSAYAPSQANMSTITNGTLYELGYFLAAPITATLAWLK